VWSVGIDIGAVNQCNTRLFHPPLLENEHEAHLPAFEYTATTSPWLPRAHAYPGWPRGHQCSASERASPPQRVSVARATFPRSVRLRGAAQFTGAFQRRFRSGNFLLLVRSGGSKQGSARLGIVIGRKQAARAADRSRIRRSIREVFRGRRTELGEIDVVVRFRGSSAIRIDSAVRAELIDLFERTVP
jgi:ribonuclease P protein component